MANRYCELPGSEKIKDTYNNINIGFDLVQQDMDSKSPSTHRHPNATGATDGFMSKEDKTKSDAATSAATANTLMQRDAAGRAKVSAPAAADDISRKAEVDAVQTDLNTHKNDVVVHVTQAEHDKLASIAEGAEVNQNAFSKINNIEAGTQSDELTIKGSTGISVTTNTTTKEVTITATGEATPGPHAETHLTGGADPIPVATENTDGLMPSNAITIVNTVAAKQAEWDGKETPSGAQAKADAAQAAAEQDATVKANQAQTNAINFAKSYGVGGTANNITGQNWGVIREGGLYMGHDMIDRPPYTAAAHVWEYGICVKHNDTHLLLTVTDFDNTETWQRVISGGVAKPWKMITDSGGFQSLKQSVVNGKAMLATVIGYVTAASTFQQMADEIHLSKRDQVIALNAKNIAANENEPLHDLTLKTAQIQVGAPFQAGTVTATSNNITVPLPFTPKFVKLFVSGSSDYMRVSSEMNVYTVRWGTSSWSQVFELGHAGGSFYLEPNQFRFTYPTNSYTFNNGNNISYEAWG